MSPRVSFVVNRLDEVRPDQTTALLMAGAASRGLEVHACDATALDFTPGGEIVAHARPVPSAPTADESIRCARALPVNTITLGTGDLILVRTNPARDPRPSVTSNLLELLTLAESRGARVENSPAGLMRAGSKLFLGHLPAHTRPRTLVSSRPAALRTFISALSGPAILKPVSGTRGQDVFKISGPDAPNLTQILDVLTRQGPTMAQDFVPDAVNGDVRLILIDGQPLRVGASVAAVRRRPPKGDFRSNIAVGGAAEPASLTPSLSKIAADVGPVLCANGIRLAGLDIIGDRIVEVNVFSTGGLLDAGEFCGVDFIPPLLDALLTSAPRPRPSGAQPPPNISAS